jgi:hypothetical protein
VNDATSRAFFLPLLHRRSGAPTVLTFVAQCICGASGKSGLQSGISWKYGGYVEPFK